jgi:hypothetical protein
LNCGQSGDRPDLAASCLGYLLCQLSGNPLFFGAHRAGGADRPARSASCLSGARTGRGCCRKARGFARFVEAGV